MDNGEVIAGLNEEWNFMGAKLMEWVAGLMMFMLSGDLFIGWGKSMPLLMMIWLGTTLSLASMRRIYPDEERGLMNNLMVYFGVVPPKIPAPAVLQPIWSAAPQRELKAGCHFYTLKLEEIFPESVTDLMDADV